MQQSNKLKGDKMTKISEEMATPSKESEEGIEEEFPEPETGAENLESSSTLTSKDLEESDEDPGDNEDNLEREPEIEEELEEKEKEKIEMGFQEFCGEVTKALREHPINRLNCRLKVLVPEKSAVIYQGLRSNVWGRLRSSTHHTIYRQSLLRMLQKHSVVGHHFREL